MTIAFKDLTDDFFEHEMKPYLRNPDGRAVYGPSGAGPTVETLEKQICPAHALIAANQVEKAVEHAVWVCSEMKGFQGYSNKPATRQSIARHVEYQARNPAATFDKAVERVIAGTDADEHGKLTSAATKMLQVLPQFSNEAIIYDNVVRAALVARGVATAREAQVLSCYLAGVRGLFAAPLVDMPDGSTLSIDVYLQLPAIRAALSAHAWIERMNLQRFVRNRLLDRALWLIAAETPAEKAETKARRDLKKALRRANDRRVAPVAHAGEAEASPL